MKRKVFEKQIVDLETGEVMSEETHYKEDNNETFGMHRTTEGIDWIFNFTGNELQMMVVLLEIEDIKTGLVALSSLQRKHLCEKFQKGDRYVREIITSIEHKNGLIRLSPSDILLNPTFFYKGGTKVFRKKYQLYLRTKVRKGKDEISTD